MRNKIIITTLIFLTLSTYTNAKTYKYVDEKGTIVFTDNLVNVPEDQRPKYNKYDEGAKYQQEDLNAESETSNTGSKLSEDDMFFIDRLIKLNIIDKDADISNVTHRDLIRLKYYFKKEDRRIYTQLLDMGLIIEHDNCKIENITDEQWQMFKYLIKMQGVTMKTIDTPPDPRFSSPEKTWELFKSALIKGNYDLVLQCCTPQRAGLQKKIIDSLGKVKMRKIAKEMRPIQKIEQDKESAKYRIKKSQKYGGKMMDITHYIYFANMFGNWKIAGY